MIALRHPLGGVNKYKLAVLALQKHISCETFRETQEGPFGYRQRVIHQKFITIYTVLLSCPSSSITWVKICTH